MRGGSAAAAADVNASAAQASSGTQTVELGNFIIIPSSLWDHKGHMYRLRLLGQQKQVFTVLHPTVNKVESP